jgi:predicted ATPase
MKVITEAKHVNDGFLRIISVLAQLFTTKDFLLFDEIENGINPELVEFLVDSLISSKHQILITTHSPMILNFIEDEEAIKSVKYIYKTKKGFTKIINFFEIPSMLKKLSVMGAGEVYVDTNLSNLYDEIISLDKEK